MPLEHINHRAREMETRARPRFSRRRFLFTGVSVVTGAALTGCASGTQQDSERGREKDASRDSVVKDLQATETWNVVHGTPPASPPVEE